MADPQPFDPWSDPSPVRVPAGPPGDGPADSGLARLAAGFLAPEALIDLDLGPSPSGPVTGGGLVLALGELIGDGNGEAVFFNEAGLSRLTLETDSAVLARGTAADHAPVDGQDVNGFAYVSFDSGLTLYYPDDLDLSLAPAA